MPSRAAAVGSLLPSNTATSSLQQQQLKQQMPSSSTGSEGRREQLLPPALGAPTALRVDGHCATAVIGNGGLRLVWWGGGVRRVHGLEG